MVVAIRSVRLEERWTAIQGPGKDIEAAILCSIPAFAMPVDGSGVVAIYITADFSQFNTFHVFRALHRIRTRPGGGTARSLRILAGQFPEFLLEVANAELPFGFRRFAVLNFTFGQ